MHSNESKIGTSPDYAKGGGNRKAMKDWESLKAAGHIHPFFSMNKFYSAFVPKKSDPDLLGWIPTNKSTTAEDSVPLGANTAGEITQGSPTVDLGDGQNRHTKVADFRSERLEVFFGPFWVGAAPEMLQIPGSDAERGSCGKTRECQKANKRVENQKA
jgi:hypothetical protein